jgi:hypothetical protein
VLKRWSQQLLDQPTTQAFLARGKRTV